MSPDTSQPQDEGRLNADTPYPYTRPQDEALRKEVIGMITAQRLRGGSSDHQVADQIVALVAKAQRDSIARAIDERICNTPSPRGSYTEGQREGLREALHIARNTLTEETPRG